MENRSLRGLILWMELLCLLLIGCSLHDPGQRQWDVVSNRVDEPKDQAPAQPVITNDAYVQKDASKDVTVKVDVEDTDADTDADEDVDQDVDVDLCKLNYVDACAADCEEVCDGIDNDCDGETDESTDKNPLCVLPEATALCIEGACQIYQCSLGYGDCDGNYQNGCEQELTDILHCGVCNVVCDLSNASQECNDNGICLIIECEEGFADCNGVSQDGCEVSLDSVNNCGSCGNNCYETEEDKYRCVDGECITSECEPGTEDCNGEQIDGCETQLDELETCGSCVHRCNPRTSDHCEEGLCMCGERICAFWENCCHGACYPWPCIFD